MAMDCEIGFIPVVTCPNFDIEEGICYHCGLGEFYDEDEEWV